MSQMEARRGPGRPLAGGEDKRERILHEALEQFAQRGYAGASLAVIARAADISKPGLLHYFGSKEELFSAVLERRDATDIPRLAEGDVWTLLDSWVELVERNSGAPDLVRLYTVMVASSADPDTPSHGWLHSHLERSIESLSALFEDGKEFGIVAPDAPSRELARMVTALSDGIQVQWLCARTDAGSEPADDADVPLAPLHGGAPLDMAAQMRLLVAMIRQSWGIAGAPR
jgi:AcrR family transcriptional regulator